MSYFKSLINRNKISISNEVIYPHENYKYLDRVQFVIINNKCHRLIGGGKLIPYYDRNELETFANKNNIDQTSQYYMFLYTLFNNDFVLSAKYSRSRLNVLKLTLVEIENNIKTFNGEKYYPIFKVNGTLVYVNTSDDFIVFNKNNEPETYSFIQTTNLNYHNSEGYAPFKAFVIYKVKYDYSDREYYAIKNVSGIKLDKGIDYEIKPEYNLRILTDSL